MSQNQKSSNSAVKPKQKKTVGNMYYVRPQYNLPDPFPDPPTTMYKMRKLVDPEVLLENGQGLTAPVDDGKLRIKDARSRACTIQNIPEAKMLEIEARQQVLLNKLTDLKDMIQTIHSKYLSEAEEAEATGRNSTAEVGSDHVDLVINADPRRPPFSLLFIYKVLCQNFRSIKFQTHLHSSMTSRPERYLNVFDRLEEQFHPDSREKICISLIWKRMNHDVELLVDPFKQTPIRGEANVARFISRLLPVNCSLNYDILPWEILVKVDGLLELASERDAVSLSLIERQLLNSQRAGPFLFNEITIADFVLFSHMTHQCASNPNKYDNSPSILRWLKDCQKYGGFELFTFY